MQSRNIAHQIIKTVSSYPACRIHVNAMKPLHNFRMIGNLKIRYNRIPISLYLYIFSVIFPDRHRRINDIRNRHHVLFDLFAQIIFFCFQFGKSCRACCHLGFLRLGLLLLSLYHQSADFFGNLISLCANIVGLLLCRPHFRIQRNHFIHKRKLLLLKFFSDILLYCLRILPQKFNVNHTAVLSFLSLIYKVYKVILLYNLINIQIAIFCQIFYHIHRCSVSILRNADHRPVRILLILVQHNTRFPLACFNNRAGGIYRSKL